MKAVTINRYGSADVLQYKEVETPKLKRDRVLVKVRATSVNPLDWKIRQGLFAPATLLRFPIILGFDLSGEVVEVGEGVTQFKPGDLVYALYDDLTQGAYAEYAVVPEKALSLKPDNLSHEEAAAVPVTGLAALQGLRELGNIEAGQKVLINGASGGVGTFAVQLAKNVFEANVTGVCSGQKAEFVKGLGADRVLDYTREDFTKGSEKYDIIFDTVSKVPFARCKSVLTPKGVYLATVPMPGNAISAARSYLTPGKKAKFVFVRGNGSGLSDLKTWIEAGQVRPIIDRTYPLSEMKAAHEYSQSERASGKIVITVAS